MPQPSRQSPCRRLVGDTGRQPYWKCEDRGSEMSSNNEGALKPNVWDLAIDSWPEGDDVRVFDSFSKYRSEAGFPNARTLSFLSIQDFYGLPPRLRNDHVMVLRLGAG